MALPEPYLNATEAAIVEGCIAMDPQAWESLSVRHGLFFRSVVGRVLDERRRSVFELAEVRPHATRAWRALRRNQVGPLRLWRGTDLRALLAVFAREQTIAAIADETPGASLVAHLPTPTEVSRHYANVGDLGARVHGVLERLPPDASAAVRLRMRGLELRDIARTMGKSSSKLHADMQRIARKLAAPQSEPAAEKAWRVILGCADLGERVATALATEDDGAFRRNRSVAEASWQVLRERVLLAVGEASPGPLADPHGVARFVDGSLRGDERAQAEGHLSTCARAADRVAKLVLDLRAAAPLKQTEALGPNVALAASAIASGRFELAVRYVEAEDARDAHPSLERLRRLALVGRALEGGQGRHKARSELRPGAFPSDDEAPVHALEALAADEAMTALETIDEHLVKEKVGHRLRILAAASGPAPEEAKRRAREVLEHTSVDPGLRDDALLVMRLPEGRELPLELLHLRMRDVLPDAVRWVTTRD